jgi:16S rRNA (cytosine967-C5)-methyltransferase
MRMGGRLSAAIEILSDIDERRRPVADALKDWGLSHRFAGAKDRAAIGNIVYDALRWRLSTAFAMGAETPRAAVLGTIGRRWGLGSAGLQPLLSGEHAPEALSDAEAAAIDAPMAADAPAHIRADVPDWLAGRFEAAFGPQWAQEGAALALRPPLDLRVNTLKADRDKVLGALQSIGARPAAHAPDGVRVGATEGEGRHPNVLVEPGYQKGWFEVQDEGSQLAAMMVGAKAGEQVLDLCAGAGGKTLALAAAMANKGQIHATDDDRGRLAPIYERLRRSGARNVQVRDPKRPQGDMAGPLDDLQNRMDRVLVDAPCTGTGTWRRRPDAKWRLTEKALEERIAEQAAVLETAADFVRPGGTLTYVTCTLLPDENEKQVAGFLSRNPGFEALGGAGTLAAASLPAETREKLASSALLGENGLNLTPLRTGTDGFFVATLRRV